MSSGINDIGDLPFFRKLWQRQIKRFKDYWSYLFLASEFAVPPSSAHG
jgi:hypothetical protein